MNIRKTVKALFLLSFFCSAGNAIAQKNYTISGSIKSKNNGESIIGASIKVLNSNYGTTSNEYGFYSISLLPATYRIVYSAIGKSPDTISINLVSNTEKNISLADANYELTGITITGNRSSGRSVTGSQMGIERLSVQETKNIPVIFGEKDLLKTIQLLPGIKTAGDGSSGIFVRGGSTDQNQIILDEANIYNAAHLFGFFSTFNSDAVKDIAVYKGGMPAQYGGRLSSVLDIRMNEGNNQHTAVSGSLGLISAKLNIEGPIQKNKSSFLITGRRTYADVFLKMDEKYKGNQLYFYDLNAKLNYELGKKDKLYLSGYFGKDILGFNNQFKTNWGNGTGTLRWNHIFNSRLFLNTSLIFSNYNYEFKVRNGTNDIRIFSQIRDWNLKQDYQYSINNKNNLRFGWSGIYHIIRPGEITANATSSISNKVQDKRFSYENAVYASNVFKPTKNLTVTLGARLSGFNVMGGGSFFNIDENGTIKDTIKYERGEVVKSYYNLEPRIAVGFMLNAASSIKASFTRNAQYMHQITNSNGSSPLDKWASTSNIIKPQISNQFSVGYYANVLMNNYEFTAEAYYKEMENVLDYRNGADLFLNETVEAQLLFGTGRAYGLELMLKKKTGIITGWISYTLSKSERKINGINNNKWYNATQDRTHDLSIVGIYQLSKKWTLSGNFVFYTGNAVTLPTGKYQVNGQTAYYYDSRNADRMPNYHRLDLGATMQLKKTKKWTKELVFSLYNVYGRENAYTINFKDNKENPNVIEITQTSLFRWVPSVSYNFKF
ncbi:TonB-dependent receptor-like protein [Lacibacter cauensis]|uniref:TonB-dependent receptor-like protein n=1 Tax=Lacibacter cauensis TaxID=510947 RepID=A0A562S921_9BACT|nr:TonB-dependent receptor [Lacibacter cauensis]TWI77921.1 TonB-dependent receptor-like protein [Lacibacter cauensis]